MESKRSGVQKDLKEPLYDAPSNPGAVKESAQYAAKHVTESLHPAFADSGVTFDSNNDCFAAEVEDTYDEAALFDGQRAFADALEQFQKVVAPKYKSQVDLRTTHTWSEVMEHVDQARNKYTGKSRKGIVKKLHDKLRTFQTAAPAIEAWLKLLPSTSIYGSVVCGGLTIILEAAVNLRKLREETLSALDQVPLCIEKAEFFIRTYGYTHVKQQTGNLYLAIIDALQHILEWYKGAAGMKYFSAFCQGPAYAEMLKMKMREVDVASQAMINRVSQRKHLRLEEIKHITTQTKDQVDDLKILAIEARNHLYAIFKDSEVWQEALQKKITTAREMLLACFGTEIEDSSRDVENALGELTSMTLGDQDRIGAFIQHRALHDWLCDPRYGALLVHGNGRRPDPLSPTSVACALLVHVFSKKIFFPTVYWFCGLHTSGPNGNPLGMVRSLICQLLSLSCCECNPEDCKDLDTQDLAKLLGLLQQLIRCSSRVSPVVCILDGISFYEGRHQRDGIGRVVRELANSAREDPLRCVLLLTSPMRTHYVFREPKIAQSLVVAEIPNHISGVKQGLNYVDVMSSAEEKARSMLESLKRDRKTKK